MSILQTLKNKITEVVKSGDSFARDIYKLALGEIQSADGRGEKIDDEKCIKIINKLIKSNNETILLSPNHDNVKPLTVQIALLSSLLPQVLSLDEIEAFFLNSNGPEFEQIQEAKSEGQAIGIAMKAVKLAKLNVNNQDVTVIVKKIRCNSQSVQQG